MTRSLDENFSVLVLVFNTFEHDARVERAAETAAQMGADVTVLCLSGLGLSSRESRGSYVVNRIGSAGNGARKDIQAHTGRRARLKASLRRQWHKMQAARNSKLYRGPVWLGERLLANRAFRMRRTEYQMLADAAVRFCAGQ